MTKDLVGSSEWMRPKPWKLDWELVKDGNALATMSSPKLFGTGVTATFGSESYALRKGGLRRPGATIRKLKDQEDTALLTLDAIGKGTITFADSSRYGLERSGERWTLSQEGRGEIFKVDRDTKVKYPVGKVSVDIADPKLEVLLLLVWFVASTSEC